MSIGSCFFDLDLSAVERLVRDWDWPPYRARRLFRWVYERGTADPMRMTDLSRRDREMLCTRVRFNELAIAQHQSAGDGTEKLLLELPAIGSEVRRRQSTECVLIPADNPAGGQRRTACISSQVGCPVGCRFCASGLGGLEKNLTAGQIVEQVWWLNGISRWRSRVTNVVFMGMGEPLSNFENVTRAIQTLTSPWGFNLSGRRITVSTVGLPAQMRRLAGIEVPLTLAVSLHAPNDALREQLIPWAQHTSIADIIDAARYYFDRTGREITLEYILLRNVNDRPEHAEQLAGIAKTLRCMVNLIRYNEVRSLPFDRPTSEDVHRFREVLARRGVNVHIRASRGRDIAAACGQLRHESATASA